VLDPDERDRRLDLRDHAPLQVQRVGLDLVAPAVEPRESVENADGPDDGSDRKGEVAGQRDRRDRAVDRRDDPGQNGRRRERRQDPLDPHPGVEGVHELPSSQQGVKTYGAEPGTHDVRRALRPAIQPGLDERGLDAFEPPFHLAGRDAPLLDHVLPGRPDVGVRIGRDRVLLRHGRAQKQVTNPFGVRDRGVPRRQYREQVAVLFDRRDRRLRADPGDALVEIRAGEDARVDELFPRDVVLVEGRRQVHALGVTGTRELAERVGRAKEEGVVVVAARVVHAGIVARHVCRLGLALRRRLDDREVEQFEESARRLVDGRGESLGTGFQAGDRHLVAALAGLGEAILGALAGLAAGFDLVRLEVGGRAVEDEHRRDVRLQELGKALDDPDQVGDLLVVVGGVGVRIRELHRRGEVLVQPVVRVDGDDASAEVVEGDGRDGCDVTERRVSHRFQVGRGGV